MSWETRPIGELLLGNGSLLVVLDPYGEIDQVFSPHLDAMQARLGSFRTSVLVPSQGGGSPEMIAIGPDAFDIRLNLLSGSQVLRAEYQHKSRPLKLIRTLAIHPVDALLLDSWQIQGESAGILHASVPWMGYAMAGHCSLYHPLLQGIVHHRGRRWLGVVGRTPQASWARVGHLPESDRRRMWDGEKVWVPVGASDLTGYATSGLPLGWDHVVQGPAVFGAIATPPVAPGQTIEFMILGAESEAGLHTLLSRNKSIATSRFLEMVDRFAEKKMAPALPLLSKIQNPQVALLAQRSLEVLMALQDRETGALIAAAEVDPHSRVSGGYGYSWPRDGAYLASALGAWGFHDRVEKYFDFLKNTQDPTGAWFQRYLATGHAGPSWGRIQIDEPATVIGAAWLHFKRTRNLFWLERIWPTIKLGLEFLESFHNEEKPMGTDSHDLWEERMGVHAYSLAAVAASFRAGAALAGELSDRKLQARYHSFGNKLAERLLTTFIPREGAIRRALITDGRGGHWADETPDVSMLGLIYPFGILHKRDEAAQRILKLVHERLWSQPVGGILRYPGDHYRGGNPWILTTLWLGIVDLSLGNTDQARECFQWSMSKATPLGMLAEQVHRESGKPFWVIPLGWSHAMYLIFVHDVLKRGLESKIWSQH